MNAPIGTFAVDRDELDVRTYASLIRVLEQCPIENKLRVFALMARTAEAGIAARRQQYVDDLHQVSHQHGLVARFGGMIVQDALAEGINGAATA